MIASLVKDESFSRAVLAYLKRKLDVYYPTWLEEELNKYLRYISKKSGLSVGKVKLAIRAILRGTKRIQANPSSKDLALVNDPRDVFYVSTALFLRKFYVTVVVLTWNKKDFKEGELRELGVIVLTPSEIVSFLGNLP